MVIRALKTSLKLILTHSLLFIQCFCFAYLQMQQRVEAVSKKYKYLHIHAVILSNISSYTYFIYKIIGLLFWFGTIKKGDNFSPHPRPGLYRCKRMCTSSQVHMYTSCLSWLQNTFTSTVAKVDFQSTKGDIFSESNSLNPNMNMCNLKLIK